MLRGHADAIAQFLAGLAAGRLHHAWLLAGPRGVGKRRFADMAALRLLAGDGEGLEVAPDRPAAALVAAGSHPDHRVIVRETDDRGRDAAEIRVDQIRALQPLFRTTAAMGGWRTVIVDSVDDLNRAAANAFLKCLEEPPPRTVFLLVSHAPARLLPTIRSRCRILRFRQLPEADVAAVLRAEGVGEDSLPALLALADGAPGAALRFAGGAAGGLDEAITGLMAGAAGLPAFARQFQAPAAQLRFEALTMLAPRRLAAAARRTPSPRLLDLQAEAETLARDAARLAYDRVQVAFALGRMLAEAGRLEGSAPNP